MSSSPGSHSQANADQDSGKRMTNADFRRLLLSSAKSSSATAASTASPSSGDATLSSSSLAAGSKGADDAAVKKKKRSAEYWRKRQERKDQEAQERNRYRDRAKERREGINPDYNESSAQLASRYNPASIVSLTSARRTPNEPQDAQSQSEEVLRSMTVEESKYLGGDMEHTHMVKGLDYALLKKVRTQMAKEGEQLTSEEFGEDESFEEPESQEALLTRGLVRPKFQSELGREIFDTLFPGDDPQHSDHHLRSLLLRVQATLVFDVNPKNENYLPTSVVKTTEEEQGNFQVYDPKLTMVHAQILNRIERAIHDKRHHRHSHRRRKGSKHKDESKTSPQNERESVEASDEFDIFADAGDYKPPTSEKDLVDQEASTSKPTVYFDTPSDPTDDLERYMPKITDFDTKDGDVPATGSEQVVGPALGPMVGPAAGPMVSTVSYRSELHQTTDMSDSAYPNTDAVYPDTDAAYPDTDAAYPDTDSAYPDTDSAYDSVAVSKTSALSVKTKRVVPTKRHDGMDQMSALRKLAEKQVHDAAYVPDAFGDGAEDMRFTAYDEAESSDEEDPFATSTLGKRQWDLSEDTENQKSKKTKKDRGKKRGKGKGEVKISRDLKVIQKMLAQRKDS